MKIFFLIITTTVLSNWFGQNPKGKNLTILVSNYSQLRPLATLEEYFWMDQKYFDTVLICSDNLTSFYFEKFQKLTPGGTLQFDHRVAFLLEHLNGQIDTLYTDPGFYYWSYKRKSYLDTSGFFQKAFGGLLISNL